MKKLTAMILDDEEWIVKSLKQIIDWELEGFSIIGQYTDSTQALQAVRREEPDLLLLDIRMPKISGDMMMEIIREEGIPCEFIILSGYNDFSIAKKAIRHSAFDYILKPLEKEELLAAVRKVKASLVERKQDELKLPIDPQSAGLFLAHAIGESKAFLENNQYFQLLLADKNSFLTMPQVENTEFSNPVTIYGGRTLWLVGSKNKPTPCVVADLIEWTKANRLSLGLSQRGQSFQEYHNMYRQANCALCSTYLKEDRGCFLYLPPDVKEVKYWVDNLRDAYQTKNQEIIRQKISGLIYYWKQRGNPASVSLLISQLTYGIITQQENKEKYIHIEKFLYDDISSQFSNLTEIFEYLLQLLEVDTDEKQEKVLTTPRTAENLKIYIKSHYAEDFNLNQLARHFYLAPTYLCDLFKRVTGETITSFLLKTRMEIAACLLTESEKSLVSISDSVGYNDYNYFCRLFKRYYGVSPTAYRKGNCGDMPLSDTCLPADQIRQC